MIPSNRSKFDKMKNVAALQTQKGPWSRDMSSTVKKSITASTDGSRQRKLLALQQQKGPWSQGEGLQVQEPPMPPPPPPPRNNNISKHNVALALQEQKGPWNRQAQQSPPLSDDHSTGSASRYNTSSPRQSLRPRQQGQEEHAPNDLVVESGARVPTPHYRSSSRGLALPVTKGLSLQSPQQIMCFCTAMSLFRKQWAVSSYAAAARHFNIWRRNINIATSTAHAASPRMSAREKTEHSVLLWLASNSKKRHLQSAWKKWMFAVVAQQNIDKNKAIESLSTALAKENEQYKVKLKDIMEKVKHRDSAYRHNAVHNTMHSFIRVKAKLALKRRFDVWSRATWQMSYDQALRREKFKMEIGFQAINSEKEVLKETEVYSARLEVTLLCLMAFQNWKLKMKEDQHSESRQQWAAEKKVIQENLLALQASLLGLNRSERAMVETAKARGVDMYASLHSVADKLGRCSSGSAARPGIGPPYSPSQASSQHGAAGGGGILKKPKKLLFEEIK